MKIQQVTSECACDDPMFQAQVSALKSITATINSEYIEAAEEDRLECRELQQESEWQDRY